MDTTDDTKSDGKSQESATVTAGVSAIFRAINIKHLDPSPLTHLPKVLELISKINSSTKVFVATKLMFYQRAKSMFEGLSKSTHSQGLSRYPLALGFFEQLDVASGAGNETLRLKRAEAAEMVLHSVVGGTFGMLKDGRDELKVKMKAMLQEGRKNERSPSVQAVLDRSLKALQNDA
jgi:proteasome component ECM29